jgi:hypothetical protein
MQRVEELYGIVDRLREIAEGIEVDGKDPFPLDTIAAHLEELAVKLEETESF